jgi:hypothetical protein
MLLLDLNKFIANKKKKEKLIKRKKKQKLNKYINTKKNF